MAFRFRRSMQVSSGLRFSFTNKGMNARIGPRGVGYTINTKGEQRISAGIPGTGLHWSEKIGKKPARPQAREAALDRVERLRVPVERVEPYLERETALTLLEPAGPNEFAWFDEAPVPAPVAPRKRAKATPLQKLGRVVLWGFATVGALTTLAIVTGVVAAPPHKPRNSSFLPVSPRPDATTTGRSCL